MVYQIEYGLHDINCGGRVFFSAPDIEKAQFKAIRLAHSLFFRKFNDNRIRFPTQKKVYEKVVKDLHLPNTWDKGDAVWDYVNNLYWSMIDDHVWYKVEEASDVDPSLFASTITWGEEEF